MNVKAKPARNFTGLIRGLGAGWLIVALTGAWGGALRAETGIGPGLPESLSFCGENVPLNQPDVYMAVDQELVLLVGARSRVWVTLRGWARIMPQIEAALKEAGVPDDFKYAPLGLSNLLPNYAGSNGRGIWQLNKIQAAALGLKVNKNLDERLDPYRSSQAAVQGLKRYRARFGSWTLAMAALLGGEAEVARLVAETGLKNYYDLPLPSATERSMAWVLAAKIMYSNPRAYGYQPQPGRNWPAYQRQRASAATELMALARKLKIPPKALKDANPHLLTTLVPAGANIYRP